MKFIGMLIGGIFSAIGHMMGFLIKNIYIEIRRFLMDRTNKNVIWNMQAITILLSLLLAFFWLIGRYQDQFYGLSQPVFLRAIPLLLPCLIGHVIYSSPIFFKNIYSKPMIQTFLNTLSMLAFGQIILNYVDFGLGMFIVFILTLAVISLTLYYTLYLNIKSTIFNKLTTEVENSAQGRKSKEGKKIIDLVKRRDKYSGEEIFEIDQIDINTPGCLSHLLYYSEECKLELFYTEPTKDQQSQLMILQRWDRAQHEQILGGTGAGKTLFASNLIVQDLLNVYQGSTIVEPKGSLINNIANFLKRVGRPFHRLDPDCDDTDCLNPLYVPEGEDIEPMIEANVSAYHGYLGPTAKDFFKNKTTNLLRVSIKALKLAYGNECGYIEVNKIIQPLEDDYRAEVLATLTEKGVIDQVGYLLEYTRNMADSGKSREYTEQTNTNLYDYLNMLTSHKRIRKMLCGNSTFSIDDALENGEIILFNGAYGSLQTLTYTVGRLFLNLLRASTFRRNIKGKVRPHQLTVDEIEMFADEEFSTFMEMAREFELFVRVIHQGNEQLEDVSRRLSSMVKQNAVQKYILAGLENKDAEYYADLIGEFYGLTQTSGTDEMSTTGFNTQLKEEKRYKVLPAEILNLRGYNNETGEAGEVLFRGVQNNKRLDPVKGLVKPLPKILFSSLEGKRDENTKEMKKESHLDKLESIKAKWMNKQHVVEKSEEIETLDQTPEQIPDLTTCEEGEEEGSPKITIRSNIWDSKVESEATEVNTYTNNDKVIAKLKKATVDDKTLQVAEKIKELSQQKRDEKESSEVE
ncbi:type IV secretory system conjugative DNA transfer family protein [Paenibacillus sonchi]|nr:TraM recognition domain-containing protein [Paenibacillus sonchi]